MNTRTFRERLLGAFLGLVVALVLLEGGLRLAHFLIFRGEPRAKAAAEMSSRMTVVCIGDSFAEGQGVPDMKRNSYPSRLQRLFDDAAPGSVRVVNRGIGGQNLYQIRRRLAGELEKLPRVDAVVCIGGMNQRDNCYGYYQYLHPGSLLLKTLDLVNRSSIVRLGRFLRSAVWKRRQRHLRELITGFSTPAGRRYADLCRAHLGRGDVPGAVRELREALRREPGATAGWLRLLELTRGDGKAFLEAFERCRGTVPMDNYVYEWAGNAYAAAGDHAAAFTAYREGLATPWGPPPGDRRNCYGAMIRLYNGVRDDPVRKRIEEFAARQRYRAPDFSRAVLSFGTFDTSIDGWIEYEVGVMSDMCRERGIPFILQTYPEPQSRNGVLRAVAMKYGIPLVDHEFLFSDMPRGKYLSRIDHQHPDREGYAMMAAQVYDVLVRVRPRLLTGGVDGKDRSAKGYRP